MRRTIADELREEGMKLGEVRARRHTLLRLLRKRFGKLPQAAVNTIEMTEDVEQLDEWLDRFAIAETLADIGIGLAK